MRHRQPVTVSIAGTMTMAADLVMVMGVRMGHRPGKITEKTARLRWTPAAGMLIYMLYYNITR